MSKSADWSEIEKTIREGETLGGTIGVRVTSSTGDTYAYNGSRLFGAASTVKIPLMIELFRQVDRNERTLDDVYTLCDDDRAAGSGVMLELHAGMQFTLQDLIYLMMSISDNTATNILIDYADMEKVCDTMRVLGMGSSVLARKMKGRPAQGDEEENWGTPDDYARVIQAILDGRAASPESSAQMITMLEKQQNKRRIARYLPESPEVRWGSKTGSIAGVTNDVGFVVTGQGSLVVSVFCENFLNQHQAEEVIGDIARAAMLATGVAKPLITS